MARTPLAPAAGTASAPGAVSSPPAAGDAADSDRSGAASALPRPARIALAIARIVVGFVFLWPFLDKTFGLGFATPAERAWITGASPTTGYLGHLDGPFAGALGALAGQAWVDWLFMLGMLLVGGAFALGVALRPAAVGAVLIMALLWLSALPLESNPVVDEHVVVAVSAVALALANAGDTWGLGRWWRSLDLTPRWALLS